MQEPVTSRTTYLVVTAALLALTAVTFVAAYADLGLWSIPLALGIATAKAALVVTYFMHLRTSDAITRLACVAGVLWLALLVVGILDDVLTRGWLPVPGK